MSGATAHFDDHGYDGDSSDGEDDGGSLLSSTLWWDAGASRTMRPPLPDFWLLMKLESDVVHLYFHARFMSSRVNKKHPSSDHSQKYAFDCGCQSHA